jgi:ABC-type amino acid transport substrate-binding protein
MTPGFSESSTHENSVVDFVRCKGWQRLLRNKGSAYSCCVMRAGVLIFALLFSCVANALGTLEKITESGSVTIGYRSYSMPLSYLDGDKRPIGYSIDVCMQIANVLKRVLNLPKLGVKFYEITPETRENALIAGTIDLECGSSSITADRLKHVSFSTPIFISTIRMMAREGGGVSSVANMRGKTAVTTKGTTSEDLFKDLNQVRSLGATLFIAQSNVESFAMLETGKADVFVLSDVLAYGLRASSKDPARFVILRDSLSHEGVGIMLRKDDHAFKKVVDTEVTRLIAQGEMIKIYRKWFESPIPPNRINLGMQPSYMLNTHFKSPGAWKVY